MAPDQGVPNERPEAQLISTLHQHEDMAKTTLPPPAMVSQPPQYHHVTASRLPYYGCMTTRYGLTATLLRPHGHPALLTLLRQPLCPAAPSLLLHSGLLTTSEGLQLQRVYALSPKAPSLRSDRSLNCMMPPPSPVKTEEGEGQSLP